MDYIDISKIAEIICGFPFQSEYFNTNGDGTRLVRGMNVTKRNLRWGEDSRWWNDFSVDLSKYQLQENDIVIGMDGSLVGKNYAKISKEDLPLLLVQRVACIRAKPNADQKFLWHCIANSRFEKYIESVKTGTTIPHISQKQISQFQIPNLPLPTQQKIAQILSSLDDKIELNNKINANLEQQAQALFKSWFVDFEPFGGEMPSGWKMGKLSELVEIKTDSFSPEKNPNVEVEHYSLPAFDESRLPELQKSEELKSNKFILSKDTLLASKLNPTVKRVWRPYCLTDFAISSTEFIVYKPKDVKNRDYIFSIINSQEFNDFMCSHVTGSTNSHQRTPPKTTLEYLVPLNCDAEMKKFCDLVTPMYNQIQNNILKNKKLSTLRDSLLPKLMNGEIEV